MYQAEHAFREWKDSGAKPEVLDRINESPKVAGRETESNGDTIMRYSDGSELFISIGRQIDGPVVRMIWGGPKFESMIAAQSSQSEPGHHQSPHESPSPAVARVTEA